ncbi:MAG: hypothetical protein C5B50_07830 [Verrucomicrobia bacterium]|nr:MAG: hypothetical protein C5B50_07830 [Verrucomicrobiota bacterium]
MTKRRTPRPLSLAPRPSSLGAIRQLPMVAPAAQPGDQLQRGGTTAGRLGEIVTAANRWRENYNPLRGLVMRRVVELLELAQRGDTAYLQWAFRFVERRYPTLSALITRCEAPLLNFDWTIQIKEQAGAPDSVGRESGEQSANGLGRSGAPDSVGRESGRHSPNGVGRSLNAMALRQQSTLRSAYDLIDNLKEAIKHLHLAEFRGYSHLQKHRAGGAPNSVSARPGPSDFGLRASGFHPSDVIHLEPLNQWCVCRDGLEGNWWWNPDSRSTSQPLQFLGPANCIGGPELPLQDFIIHTVDRPIDEIALVNFVRANLCEKDADAFMEIFGIPSGVVIMPPNVPQGKEGEFELAAKLISQGGSGALPNGSEYKPNDSPRGVDPFTPRLRHLDEQVVLVGTGGKLTMLTEGGSGTLAGAAHQDTFEDIAAARAEKISECFQRDFDAEVLAREHPGEPVLAGFTLTPVERGDEASLAFTRELVKGLLRNPQMGSVLLEQINLKETIRASGAVINEEVQSPMSKVPSPSPSSA